MALPLPNPATPTEKAAQDVVRAIERSTPILPATPVGRWVAKLSELRVADPTQRPIVMTAAATILRALVITDRSQQWAILTHVDCSTDHSHANAAAMPWDVAITALAALHAIALTPGPDPAHALEALARSNGRALLRTVQGQPGRNVMMFNAYRTGYVQLRARLLPP